MNDTNSTLSSINELESIISADRNVDKKKSENKILLNTEIPKPFNKFLDINGRGASKNKDPINKTTDSIISNGSPLNQGICQSPNTFMESIPESNLLEGCVCFADVWSKDGAANFSYFYGRILKRMGATVVRSFTKRDPITHLIFKDGHNLYLNKAKKRNILIMTCTWIRKCRVTQIRVEEKDFLFNNPNYKPPKKFKEMQPIDAEEQLIRSIEKERRLKNRKTPKKKIKFFSPLLNGQQKEGISGKTLALETPYHEPLPLRYVYPRYIPETPDDSITRKIERMKAGKSIFTPPSSPCSSTSSVEDADDDKSNFHVGNHVPIYAELSKRLSFSDSENNATVNRKQAVSDKEVLSPNKSDGSDMELTCVNVKGLNINCDKTGEKSERNSLETNSTLNSNSSCSSMNLHLSPSQSSMSCHSSFDKTNSNMIENHSIANSHSNESSMCLRLEESKNPTDSTLSQTTVAQFESIPHEIKVMEPPVMNEIKVHKKLNKRRAHRKLCDEEVLKPASILFTPTLESQSQTPRRSRRKSSAIASAAINSTFFQDTRPSSTFKRRQSSFSNSSVTSLLLPPVGEATVKLSSNRGRFFSTPTNISEVSSLSSPSRSRETSLSASFEEMDIPKSKKTHRRESTFVDDFIAAGLSGKKANARGSTLLKRNRPSSGSGSSCGENSGSCRKANKKIQCCNQSALDKNTNNRLLISEPIKPRPSIDEFLTPRTTAGSQLVKKKQKKMPVIVLTSFHKDERIVMERLIRQLGHFRIHSRVKDEKTSHVICGESSRTINVLLGISRGLWLLSKEWVIKSHEAGQWLPEEQFEAHEYFPAARYNRLQRLCNLDTATSWKSDLFSSVGGHIYIAPNTTPSTEDIKELVTSNGGHVISSPGRAAICVGHMFRSRGLKAVQEMWVLDSISENELKSTEQYLIPTKSI